MWSVHLTRISRLFLSDMGLGKTIQGVASMAIYHREWPLLVLTPSSARYHWESEFVRWLGIQSDVNKAQGDGAEVINADALIYEDQVNVMGSAKDKLFPTTDTKVVICSYGLVTGLAESGKLLPSMFPCAIVDESHMLKNKASKRTATLLPILKATRRCVLLSGTPALARPAELWPQIDIIGTEQHGWWANEQEFNDRYVRGGTAQTRAELHTMLTGTVMIRRMKNEILKSMPRKLREKASLNLLNDAQKREFREMLAKLRQGKGAMGKLARQDHEEARSRKDNLQDVDDFVESADNEQEDSGTATLGGNTEEEETHRLNQWIQSNYDAERRHIKKGLELRGFAKGDPDFKAAYEADREKLQIKYNDLYQQRLQEIKSRYSEDQEGKRVSVLSKLYERTGEVKLPMIAYLLKRWLNDKTKGKLCIFAHHISVLDELNEIVNLYNREDDESSKCYIRIDGSTSPKMRQQQINAFQTDPACRIALLGITAAGVAVTLTASSTVWFAELFWTPAIMVQAEDRCHRIGQQARVRCLYFVARGTVDEILWRLIEKKFQDLGEFVEGKEKLKMVVDKTYTTVHQLCEQFQALDSRFDEDDEWDDDDDENGDASDDDDVLDANLERDIEALGKEECKMIETPDGSDPTKIAQTSGQTEDDAIALSDDEEMSPPKPVATTKTTTMAATATNGGFQPVVPQPPSHGFSASNFRAYRIRLQGPKLGIEIGFYQQRPIVSRVNESRVALHGENSKPAVGDVLVGLNGHIFPTVNTMSPILVAIRQGLQRGAVTLTLCEEPNFTRLYKAYLVKEREKKREKRRAEDAAKKKQEELKGKSSDEVTKKDVIEIE